MKVVILGLGALLLGITLIELGLRLLGLGNPPLYQADETIGYLLAPNQQLRRFGRRIEINQYAMRTQAIEKSRPQDTVRAFLIGDSIVNGNWWTDQSQTLSALLTHELSQHVQPPVEVLNASANSWGPRNELAYLQRFGTFEAQVVVLVINTDDLFGTQPSSLQVGKDRSYPDKKPPLALTEIISRMRKQPPIPGLKEIQNEPGDRIGKNLAAIEQMQQYVKASKGEFLLAMTPLKREVINGPRDYEIKARQRLDDLVAQHHIPYIDFLASFQTEADPAALYRDHIHLSPVGNRLVTQSLAASMLRSVL